MKLTDQIKSLFKQLSPDEQIDLLEELTMEKKEIPRKSKDVKTLECLYCKETDIVKNGKSKGSQRYKYKICNRNFMEKTNSIFQGINEKEKFGKGKKGYELSKIRARRQDT